MPKEEKYKYIKPNCPRCSSSNTRVDEKKSQLKCQYCGYSGHWEQFFEGTKERVEVQKLFRKGELGGEFHKKPRKSARVYYQEHRVQRLEYGKDYYRTHQQQAKEHYRTHQQQAKEYYQTHRDKILAYTKVHLKKYLSIERNRCKWNARFLAYFHKRQALLASCEINDLTTDEMRFLLEAAQVCAICGKPFDKTDPKKKKTIDHIIPISKNGNHTLSNIQIAHGSCNSKKGNRSYTPLQLVLA